MYRFLQPPDASEDIFLEVVLDHMPEGEEHNAISSDSGCSSVSPNPNVVIGEVYGKTIF